MAIDLLQFPASRPCPAMRVLRISCSRSVKIAVRLLSCTDFFNQSIDIGFQLRIWLDIQSVSCALNHLINVGVIEGITGRSFVLHHLAPEHRASPFEVVDALCLLVLLKGKRDRNFAVNLQAWRPESIVE